MSIDGLSLEGHIDTLKTSIEEAAEEMAKAFKGSLPDPSSGLWVLGRPGAILTEGDIYGESILGRPVRYSSGFTGPGAEETARIGSTRGRKHRKHEDETRSWPPFIPTEYKGESVLTWELETSRGDMHKVTFRSAHYMVNAIATMQPDGEFFLQVMGERFNRGFG